MCLSNVGVIHKLRELLNDDEKIKADPDAVLRSVERWVRSHWEHMEQHRREQYSSDKDFSDKEWDALEGFMNSGDR